MENEQQTLFTINQFTAVEKAFSSGSIRSMIYADHGLTACGAIIRIGRRVLINREKFMKWAEVYVK